MPSKSKPLSQKELAAYEAKRDLAAELLQSVREVKAGHVHVVSSPVIGPARKRGCRSLSSPRFLVHRCVPCRGGNKVVSSHVVLRARCSRSRAPIRKHFLQ